MKKLNQSGNTIVGFLLVIGFVWFIASVFSEDEQSRSYSDSAYDEGNYVEYSSFEGYECTDDCSGHEAGYSWAEENYITDPSECDGNSNSFIEGCISYAEENY